MPRNSLPPFLKKLRHITQTLESKVASWSLDGASFEIHDNAEFEKVLKAHFKGNIQTFVRQLHFYGFRKFENDKNEFSFSHEYFKRDQPHLIFAIKRKTRGETLDAVVTNGELRGISGQINQLDNSVQGLKRDMAKVFKRLGFEVEVGLGSYDLSKRRRLASAGSELIAATHKQGVELKRKAVSRAEKQKMKDQSQTLSKNSTPKGTITEEEDDSASSRVPTITESKTERMEENHESVSKEDVEEVTIIEKKLEPSEIELNSTKQQNPAKMQEAK